jgi:hypothetical protein
LRSSFAPMSERKAFQRKYSERQERAIRDACTVHGMTVAAAVAAAAQDRDGKCGLPGAGADLAPFTITNAAAGGYASDERRKREVEARAHADPASIVAGAVGRLAAVIERELERVEAVSRTGRGTVDPARIGALAKAGREVHALAKLTGHNATQAPEGDGETPEPGGDFIGTLTERAAAHNGA